MSVFLCALLVVGSLSAQQGPETAVDNFSVGPKRLSDYDIPGLEVKVNLKSVVSWDVVQLIDFLADRGGIKSIIIGQGVDGMNTKLRFDDVTVGEALDVVLSMNSLAYTVKGDILTILTDAEYRTLYGESFYNQREKIIVPLRYADAVRVSTMLGAIKSTIGTIVSDPVTGNLILIDTPDKIIEMQAVIRATDIPSEERVGATETKTFELKYGDIATIEPRIADILSKNHGSVWSDERTKTLIVTDLAHKMRQIDQLVMLFDRRPRQVFIESKIVQIGLHDDYRLGINWNHLFQGMDPRFSLSAAVSPVPVAILGGDLSKPVGRLEYNTIAAGQDLSVVLDALKTVGDTRILSNPHVACLDGEEAAIKVVTDQPYAEAQFLVGSTHVVGQTIKFIEVGVTLMVRPRINEDEMIKMEIHPEFSSVVGTYQATHNVPIVRRAFADTDVLVKNEETIIIAGMIETDTNDTVSAVPFLGAIPLLGQLFKSTRQDTVNRELIVFLTPRIVTGDKAYLRMKDMRKKPKPMRSLGFSDASASSKRLKPLR
jgi:type II secretory pathway component GspD/PulD (secretin)